MLRRLPPRQVPSMMKTVVAILALVLAGTSPASAYHRKTPTLLQITPNGTGTIGNPRWAGFRYVVFDSDGDILGTGVQTSTARVTRTARWRKDTV